MNNTFRAVLIGGLIAATPLASSASESFDAATAISKHELRSLRGGMTVMGVDFEFGAVSTTTLDGITVARTTFTFDDSGTLMRNTEIIDPSAAQVFEGGAAGVSIDPGALANLSGVVLPGDGSASLALSDIRPGSFINALLNDATDRMVEQRFDVRFAINDAAALQAASGAARDAARLASNVGTAAAGLYTRP